MLPGDHLEMCGECFLFVTMTGVNVKDGPLKLKIVLHKMSLTSTYETLKE